MVPGTFSEGGPVIGRTVFDASGYNSWMRKGIYEARSFEIRRLAAGDFRILSEIIRECREAGHPMKFWGVRLNDGEKKAFDLRQVYAAAVRAGICLPELKFLGRTVWKG